VASAPSSRTFLILFCASSVYSDVFSLPFCTSSVNFIVSARFRPIMAGARAVRRAEPVREWLKELDDED
jgi:hypothetical protein